MATRMERRAAQDESRLQKALARLTANACELMLARHGETDWNTEHRLQGQLLPGPSLNAQGLQQAEELSSRLAEEKFDAIYTSDLARTLETVDQIKCNHPLVPVTVLTSLRERNLGVLQGLTMGEAAEAYPQTVAKLSSPETSHISDGVESLAALENRVSAALEDIAACHKGQRVLVVTHGGVLRAAYMRACGVRTGSRLGNCSLSLLHIDTTLKPPLWVAPQWGETGHLSRVDTQAFGGGLAG